MAAKERKKTQQPAKTERPQWRRDVTGHENDGGRRGTARGSFWGRTSWIMHKKYGKIDQIVKLIYFSAG